MDFTSYDGEPLPGYYIVGNNITEEVFEVPIPIDLNNNDDDGLDLGLYLKDNGFYNENLDVFLDENLQFPDNLTDIDCENNHFTELRPNLPKRLLELNIRRNNFTELPTFSNDFDYDLEYLFCDNNQISSINSLPPRLIDLQCSFNGLQNLPDQLPSTLQILNVHSNLLKSLPTTLPDTLKELKCSINNLNELPNLPPNLEKLDCTNNSFCTNNSLTTLPIFPESLRVLFCRGNNFDQETISRIIQFYEKAIKNNYTGTNPSFQEELNYFTTRRSITTNYSLANQDVDIPPDVIHEINTYAGFRDYNTGIGTTGGKKTLNKKSLKKNSKKRKLMKKKTMKKKTMKKRQRK